MPFFLGCVFVISSCDKNKPELKKTLAETAVTESAQKAAPACTPVYYQLVVDPGSGNSFIFKTSGSPSAGPVISSSFFGSCGDNAIRVGGCNPVKFVTGIATDPSGTVIWGTTGPASNVPNSLLKIPIADVSLGVAIPLVSTCGILLDLSDIEYNSINGRYYALNRGSAAANNRIVQIQPSAAVNVICLASTVPVNRRLRGLTFGCNGQGYVMQMVGGATGKIWSFNLVTGATGAPNCNYGIVAPGALAGTYPEMGLHFDCSCIGKFITGNYDPVTGVTRLTDGMPACIGAASYAFLAGAIKPTVDYAKP